MGFRDSVFSITCLSIPGIWKKKYHSLCSATALVNNPSLGATSESPAWFPAWWVPCQFRRRSFGGGGLLREERVRRGKGGEKSGGGKGASKPALASSLEYYLYCPGEWVGYMRKGRGKEELNEYFSLSLLALFCHHYLLHPPPQHHTSLLAEWINKTHSIHTHTTCLCPIHLFLKSVLSVSLHVFEGVCMWVNSCLLYDFVWYRNSCFSANNLTSPCLHVLYEAVEQMNEIERHWL